MSHIAKDILINHIKENQEKLYRIAYTYTKNQDLAFDVVQEAITKALENISKIRHEEFIKTWFYRILINEALKTVKKNQKFIECELDENENYFQNKEEELIENIEIYNSLQKLDIKLKTVILLRFFEDLKIEEVARITGTNVSTVKSRLYKGLKEMKENMEKKGGNFK